MRRTQLYLDENDYTRLTGVSRSTGKTMSELIREALRNTFETGFSKEDRVALLRSGFGIWKDRRLSEEKYLRKLRKGTRVSDLWK